MKKVTKILSVFLIFVTLALSFSACDSVDKEFYDVSDLELLGEMAEIHINTDNADVSDTDDYTTCSVSVTNCQEKYGLDGIAAGIRLRGNSTRYVDKKAYRIKFDKKQNLLGLNEGQKFKSWVLLADYYDPSMVRNSTAFFIGQGLLEDNWYCSDYTYVEVYLNGEYNGVYLLAEQQQINEGRIDINEVDEGYTGVDIGYLLECIGEGVALDKYRLELTDRRCETQISSQRTYEIKNDYYAEEQADFIYNYLNDVFYVIYHAIYNGQFYTLCSDYGVGGKYEIVASADTDAYNCISRVFDVEAAVNMYVLSETAMNMDVCNSFFIYVDYSASGNKKLTIAAPWDFDFAFGNAEVFPEMMNTSDYYSSNMLHVVDEMTNPWYVLLAKADFFNEMAANRWKEVYESVMLKALTHIKQVTFSYEQQFQRNYAKWDTLGSTTMWLQSEKTNKSFKTQADAAKFVYKFLKRRIEWLNTQWA